MSKIGKQEIKIPQGVSVKISDTEVVVNGPKGKLTSPVSQGILIAEENGALWVTRNAESKHLRAHHGLCRSLLNNAVQGVSEGFRKELEIVGVGYRAAVKGKFVEFNLGYSHVINFPIPEGIAIAVERNTALTIDGIDKQQVGQVAAEIRKLRPPEVYKGKGIRYKGEHVRRKAGKAAG